MAQGAMKIIDPGIAANTVDQVEAASRKHNPDMLQGRTAQAIGMQAMLDDQMAAGDKRQQNL